MIFGWREQIIGVCNSFSKELQGIGKAICLVPWLEIERFYESLSPGAIKGKPSPLVGK